MQRTPGEDVDLWGEVPVSRADVELWLDCVARLPADSPRRAWYERAWNVPQKVRRAKLTGAWPPGR